MTKSMDNKSLKIIIWSVLFFALTGVFYIGGVFFPPNFQKDSESLVIGKIILDKNFPENHEKANLGFATSGTFIYDSEHISEGYNLLKEDKKNTKFSPYFSQFGLQGIGYSFIYNDLGINKLERLNLLSAALTAISLLVVTWGFSRSVGMGFAIVFLLSVSLSPWVIAFAKNLYWSPFLWFAPSGVSICAYLFKDYWYKYIFLVMIFVSIFIKSLCGYEYISTIIWFSCSIFLIDPFLRNSRFEKVEAIKYAIFVFCLGVAGFLLALIIHANIRGDTIVDGLISIWERDVKRRTYGSPLPFSLESDTAKLAASLTASPLMVLSTYLACWKTPLLILIPGRSFMVLMFLSLTTIIYKFKSKNLSRWRDFGLFFVFAVGPISWFILAKSHSYDHMHINYVLWYFGFVAAIIYISFEGILIVSKKILKYFSDADKL